MRSVILTFAALLAACAATPEPAPSGAAPAAATPALPCTSDAHRAFDFWIGEWDVFALNGTQAGTNSIQPAEYGCLLIERWTDMNGITGQSYNFLDPGTGKWRQIWVSAGSVIDYSGGVTETGAMQLEGTIANQAGGPVLPFRGTWTLNADGTVTQHMQQGDPAIGGWSDWFTGTYVRKPAP